MLTALSIPLVVLDDLCLTRYGGKASAMFECSNVKNEEYVEYDLLL